MIPTSNQIRFDETDETEETDMSENTVVVAEATVVAPVVVTERTMDQVAAIAVELVPGYKVLQNRSTTFKNLTLIENEKENWKKGLIYLICRYSKGINLEMWMYSTKKGAHLVEHVPTVRTQAQEKGYEVVSLGLAIKVRLQIPHLLSDEEMRAKIQEFMTHLEPTLQEIRGKIPTVSKKETKAKKEEVKAEAVPAIEATPAPDAEAAAPVEAAAEPTPAPVPVVEEKKSKKQKSK